MSLSKPKDAVVQTRLLQVTNEIHRQEYDAKLKYT
jgi:hypothetical protein